jgi:hypothetical protein
MSSEYFRQLEQVKQQLAQLTDYADIVKTVFDYNDDNASAASIPEFKASSHGGHSYILVACCTHQLLHAP